MVLTQSERVTVRAFTQDDWADVHALAADWSKAPGPAFDKWPTSEKDTKGLLGMFINKNNQFFAVCLKKTNHVIGLISLTTQDEKQSEIGHVILSKYQDNDIDKETIGSVVDHVFTRTETQSIITHNSSDHLGQIEPLKTLGFKNMNAKDRGEYIITRADWEEMGK